MLCYELSIEFRCLDALPYSGKIDDTAKQKGRRADCRTAAAPAALRLVQAAPARVGGRRQRRGLEARCAHGGIDGIGRDVVRGDELGELIEASAAAVRMRVRRHLAPRQLLAQLRWVGGVDPHNVGVVRVRATARRAQKGRLREFGVHVYFSECSPSPKL